LSAVEEASRHLDVRRSTDALTYRTCFAPARDRDN